MLTNAALRLLVIVITLAGLLAIGYAGALRVNEEAANNTVALAVDYTEVAQAAALSGIDESGLLTQLKQAGATHVAITEQTLEQALGEVPGPWPLYLQPHVELPESQPWRVSKALRAKLPGVFYKQAGRAVAKVSSPIMLMRDIGVGYDHHVEVLAWKAGLAIVARPLPDFVHTRPSVDASLDAAKDTEADLVVFAGSEVLGYKGLIEYVAAGLQQRGLQWGMIEIVPQQGEYSLARALDYKLIRTHSISAQEMLQTFIPDAIRRFSLAVRERKVRLCYVRLSFIGDDPAANNVDYVGQLAQRLQSDGFTLGSPVPHAAIGLPAPIRAILVAVVVVAACMLYLCLVGGRTKGFDWLFALVAAGAALLSGLPWGGALLAALIFPTLGVCSLRLRDHPHPRPALRGLGLFIGLSLVSTFGGLMVAAFLTDLPHLSGVELFRGVKLAQFLPILVVAFVFAARSMRSYREVRLEMGEHSGQWPALRAGIQEMLGYAVRYWHVLAILFGVAAVAMLLMRSGNEPLLPVPGLEVKLRALLDNLLGVRPRSKEIFFAHPLMVVALIWLASGARRGLWVALTAGMIGQVSIINTFCHLHTPLVVALTRTGHGLWIGLLGGLVLWAIIRIASRLSSPHPASEG